MTLPAAVPSFVIAAISLAVSAHAIGPVPSGRDQAAPLAMVVPGREEDARVARIAFRLATAARARCAIIEPASGMVLQHLSQFHPADRAGIIAALPLDRGPGVIVVTPGSPAERAGIGAGDILLAIDGRPLPPETGLDRPFSAQDAHARADAIGDLLAAALARPAATLTLLRGGQERTVTIAGAPACFSRVHLARSSQRNAYADGRHVFLTTAVSTDTDDTELAFLIAHEMAHNVLGHAAVMRGNTVKQGLGRTFGKSGAIIREAERSADRLGGQMMLDAGFDPVAGIGILRRLGGPDLGIALFADHDPTARRIAVMQALAANRAVP